MTETVSGISPVAGSPQIKRVMCADLAHDMHRTGETKSDGLGPGHKSNAGSAADREIIVS